MIRSLSLSLALVLSLLFTGVAEAKIGVATFAQVVQTSDMGKAATKLLDSRVGKDQKALEKQFQDFQKQAQDFQKQAAALSEKARVEKAQALDKKARELEAKRTELAKKVAPIQQKINEQITGTLQEAVENVAKDEGLEIVFDRVPPVTYVTKGVDITDKVLKEVNKLWKAKGGKFKV